MGHVDISGAHPVTNLARLTIDIERIDVRPVATDVSCASALVETGSGSPELQIVDYAL